MKWKNYLKEAKKAKQPAWLSPMLATLVDEPFSKPGWIYEKKFDGLRCLAFCKQGKVKLYSRNRRLVNTTYPELVQVLQKMGNKNFILDGEVVVNDGKIHSFELLQTRMNVRCEKKIASSKLRLKFWVFDLVYFDQFDLRNLPLIQRKEILKHAIPQNRFVRYTSHQKSKGLDFFKRAAKQGFEGAIAKEIDSKYRSSRSRSWLKFKVVSHQEFVICGYTLPQGSRVGFGALLIGYYKRGKLKFAGKVGTGYDRQTLSFLIKKLRKLEVQTSPLDEKIRMKSVHWVRPTLVCECGFTMRTKEGRLRHPRFLGLRKDKPASQVGSS